MNDMVSMRKIRLGSEGAAGRALPESAFEDFVRGGKAIVYQPLMAVLGASRLNSNIRDGWKS
jgi:hypothetical protein